MPSVLLFAGTSEGRELAERLIGCGLQIYVSVATGYGEALLPRAGLHVLQGRMDKEQIEQFLRAHTVDCVVDATHPYAVLATKNIQSACHGLAVDYLRLLRERTEASFSERQDYLYVENAQAAVDALYKTQGNVLLTTGSKDLSAFTQIPDYQQRLFVRILPSVEAVQHGLDLGVAPSRLICMQGPFSKELNLALLHQFAIQTLVTKESGKAGGFTEKLEAAQEAGIQTIVIGRPPQAPGDSLESVWAKLKQRFSL
ncbi:precorrin-6A reductase [Clostridium sp. D33t1_170424_F3]|uniref:precorrin-6A reductase n=1 Tax=Clostridium sp. D33t1_170424_F3 TaxID=2787099 RepID=UPI0018A8DB43|nr:precorrin-6A reductase [Clostridium sp. D33t1_170424_F3]